MPDKIYLPSEKAGDRVVQVDGVCYERVGPSDHQPTVSKIDASYADCKVCIDSQGSSGMSSETSEGSEPPCCMDYFPCNSTAFFSPTCPIGCFGIVSEGVYMDSCGNVFVVSSSDRSDCSLCPVAKEPYGSWPCVTMTRVC